MSYHKFPAAANFYYPDAYKPLSGLGRFQCEEGAITFNNWSTGAFQISMQLGEGNDTQYDVSTIGGNAEGDGLEAGQSLVLHQGEWRLVVYPSEGLRFELLHGDKWVLKSGGNPFGVSNRRQALLLERDKEAPIYGLGEKTGRLDKNNRAWHFWNTDACADHPHTFGGDDFDPPYVSIPLMITRGGGSWFGLLFHNPTHCTFQLNLNPDEAESCFAACHGMREGDNGPMSNLTADMGRVDVYLIPGPTLAEVLRGIAELTGVHPLPPHWALGYHQCRWGYSSAREIREVADELAKARIPVAAMWMDIDYMDEFRVFTFHPEHFSSEDLAETRSALLEHGTRLVTMIDPGVKVDPEWTVYHEALEGGHLCLSPAGTPYIGMVWPGRTAFPDFSHAETRHWWGGWIARHLERGIDGIWIDMNDPSTGSSDYEEMLFENGRVEHDVYHNQYANLMAKAVAEGFRLHDANLRPFILTRSASTGIQREAAVWTGDNVSNEVHLRQSIPMSLNLSLSGVSFNGPDVGGFAGDTTEELLVTWFLLGSLFPFFRNHTSTGTRDQEPTRFTPGALETIRRCINTRCKLLPLLTNLFHEHHQDGQPVMRPLSFEFDGEEFERVDDVYLVGPHVMIAPFTDLDSKERDVPLPKGWWYGMMEKKWIKGGKPHRISRTDEMPLYIRDGALLPGIQGVEFLPQPDYSKLELHAFLHDLASTSLVYREEDGETLDWESGAYNEYQFTIDTLEATGALVHDGWKKLHVAVDVHFYGKAPKDAVDSTTEWPFGSHATKSISLSVIEGAGP